MKTASGNRTYASNTKHEKKICIAGDSHIKPVKRCIFIDSINNGNAYLKSFNGANI